MKNIFLLLILVAILPVSSFAGGGPQFNVVPTSHPDGCNAMILRNLAEDGASAMTWTFSPPAINALTGLPVGSMVVTAPNEPVVYWPATPAYSSLTIGYDGETQDFNTCDCNPFASGSFFDAPLICNTDHYCGNTAEAYIEDFLQNGTPNGGLGANGDGCLFCGPYTTDHQGSIENNSWLKFIADATSIDFDIQVFGGCYIQFAVYEYDPAAPLGTNGVLVLMTPISWTNVDTGFTGTHTITANGLTPGSQYYLHFDGHGGADCDYEIGFASGIVTIDAFSSAASVCAGDPVTLTATPNDPSATYTWTDNFGNTYPDSDQIVVNPTVPTTYSVEVLLTGCTNEEQTLDIAIDPCPLPVELTNFDVTCADAYTELTWQTESEYNNDYFEVEKADETLEFVVIDKVQGAGSTNQVHYYAVQDSERNNGDTYYRIRQVDYDGSESYSEIISTAACTGADFEIVAMYFNQSTDEIVIDFNTIRSTSTQLNMVDISGRSYISEVLVLEPNLNQIKIKAEQLAGNTMYIVNLTSNSTSDTERVYLNR